MTPLAFVVPAPLVAALLPLALPRRSRKAVRTVLAAAAASLAFLAIGRVDALSLTFVALVSIVGALATAFSAGGAAFERRDGDLVGDPDEAAAWSRVSVYYGLLGGFWSAMLLVVVASNFTVLWIGISATTLATAFLVGFRRRPRRARSGVEISHAVQRRHRLRAARHADARPRTESTAGIDPAARAVVGRLLALRRRPAEPAARAARPSPA